MCGEVCCAEVCVCLVECVCGGVCWAEVCVEECVCSGVCVVSVNMACAVNSL